MQVLLAVKAKCLGGAPVAQVEVLKVQVLGIGSKLFAAQGEAER